MQFIKPHEISGKILTLIEEAREELIIVSPYVKIREWNKMIKALQKAVQKGVNVIFIARLNCKQDLSILDDLDIKPILIMDLHAKVYINESSAVVTSHNLYYYSDTNSIELGHFTEDVKEIKELKKFVDVYLLDKPVNTVKFSERKKYELKEDFEFLKQWEVEKLKDFFEDKYPNKKITSTSSYIFSDDILGFCDLMISGSFTIKFWKNNTDDSIIESVNRQQKVY